MLNVAAGKPGAFHDNGPKYEAPRHPWRPKRNGLDRSCYRCDPDHRRTGLLQLVQSLSNREHEFVQHDAKRTYHDWRSRTDDEPAGRAEVGRSVSNLCYARRLRTAEARHRLRLSSLAGWASAPIRLEPTPPFMIGS